MLTSQELRAMQLPRCVERLAEIDDRLAQLGSKHRPSRADESEAEDLATERAQVESQRHRLDMQARIARGDRSLAREGENGMHRLDGSPTGFGVTRNAEADYQPVDQLPGQRSVAMRKLDELVKRGLPARAAEVCERLVGVGPEHERSWTARWITETGNDHYRNAFAKLLVHGEQGAGLRFTPQEREAFERVVRLKSEMRAMSLTDSAGGYLVPFELDPTVVLTSAGSINPLLQISRVVNTVSDVWHGVSSAGVSAQWLAEADEAADASPTLAEPAIPSYKMSCFVPFSVELEGDATALMMELGRLLQDGASQLLNTALTTGSGTGQPTGIITALAGGSSVVSAITPETFTAPDIYAVQNALPARFSANAQWCANLAIINAARQFESSAGAIRFPELAQNPAQLLGRNVNECSNMDGVINAAASENNHVLLYGDFTNYVVTQRVGSSIELIPHLVGSNRRPTGQRGVWLWGRWGADSVNDNAFRVLNVATTA